MKKVYLDANATTRTDERVIKEMLPYLGEIYGNASSLHSFGREARKAVEKARRAVARLLNASSEQEIIFTSGGTESDNIAVKGAAGALAKKGRHVITSSVEHPAVLNPCHELQRLGYDVTFLDVDENGLIDAGQLRESIREDTVLVSIMGANNETGTIMPVKEIGEVCRGKEVLFHCDAVQLIGKQHFDVKEYGCDLVSVSAHKFHGPKGAGALFIRKGVKLHPVQQGGHQEKNIRPGTHNTPGIVGLGKACDLAREEGIDRYRDVARLRDRLEEFIRTSVKRTRLNGHPQKRLPNTLNVTFDYLEGESIMLSLDLEGIAVSTGSACTSGNLKPSHVLKSMGVDPLFAQGSVRFSLDKYCTEEDIDHVIRQLPPVIERLRKMSPVYEE
jgi:cysteine desulfurase